MLESCVLADISNLFLYFQKGEECRAVISQSQTVIWKKQPVHKELDKIMIPVAVLKRSPEYSCNVQQNPRALCVGRSMI